MRGTVRLGLGKQTNNQDFSALDSAIDPVLATMVRQTFRQLDIKKRGLLGPATIKFFADHVGALPMEVLKEVDSNNDGCWSVKEFALLCTKV